MNAIQIADSFDLYAAYHAPDGWPAVQQKQLTEAALMLRKQHEAIVKLRDALTRQLWYTGQLEMIVYDDSEIENVHDIVQQSNQALADTEEFVK